jgi:hypothetical protein
MAKRFSNLLLSGKACTLPFLMQNSLANYAPSFNDVMNTNISQIEVPVDNVVNLISLGSSPYGSTAGVNGAAQICSEQLPTSPTKMSLVLTGLLPGDTLFIATATSLGGNESLNANVKIGTQKLLVPVVSTVTGPANSVINVTLSLNLNDLISKGYNIAKGGTFYLQSVAFPAGAVSSTGVTDWSKARISKLDVITIGPCVSTYGSTYSY